MFYFLVRQIPIYLPDEKNLFSVRATNKAKLHVRGLASFIL